MQIQILSDLHLEIERLTFSPEEESYTYDFPVKAEMLALLGDIGCTVHEQLFEWLKVQLKRFTHVFFVMGNHGMYSRTNRGKEALILPSHTFFVFLEPYGSSIVSPTVEHIDNLIFSDTSLI